MIFVNRFLASRHLDANRSHARCLAPVGLALQRAAVCDGRLKYYVIVSARRGLNCSAPDEVHANAQSTPGLRCIPSRLATARGRNAPTTSETSMKTSHIAALVLLSWTLVISMPRSPAPETKTGFPSKRACEQAAAKWRANFETQVKEGTIRTDTDRRRRLARAIPSTKCVEDTKIPSANP
jgi:hypothetical protein